MTKPSTPAPTPTGGAASSPLDWPNGYQFSEELNALLEEGLRSGPATKSWDEIVAEFKARHGAGEV